MLKATIDGFGGSVAGAWSVEVGQDVLGPLGQGATELAQLDQRCRDTVGEGVDDGPGLRTSPGPVGVAVSSDESLVDAPGELDLHVLVTGEERFEALVLTLGKQVGAQLVAGILIAALWLGWVLLAQERTERAAILLEASRRDGGDRRTRKRRRSG